MMDNSSASIRGLGSSFKDSFEQIWAKPLSDLRKNNLILQSVVSRAVFHSKIWKVRCAVHSLLSICPLPLRKYSANQLNAGVFVFIKGRVNAQWWREGRDRVDLAPAPRRLSCALRKDTQRLPWKLYLVLLILQFSPPERRERQRKKEREKEQDIEKEITL